MTQFSASSFRVQPAPENNPAELSAFSTSEPSSVTFRAEGLTAAPGQVVEVPIYAEVRGAFPIRTLLLNLRVTAVDGTAAISDNLSFLPHPLLGGPTFGGGGTSQTYGGAWLDPNHPGLLGNVQIGTLYVPIPANATAKSAFLVHFDRVSASPNGIGILPATTHDGVIIMHNRPGVGWNDGIPDAWRIQYFGTLTDLGSQAQGDSDRDGVTNRSEFDLGTNPVNPNDHLTVSAGLNPQRAIKLRFPTAAGSIYQLEVSSTLSPGSWTTVQTGILGTGSEIEISSSASAPFGYYRVRVQE
jgi:hypothetical protein